MKQKQIAFLAIFLSISGYYISKENTQIISIRSLVLVAALFVLVFSLYLKNRNSTKP